MGIEMATPPPAHRTKASAIRKKLAKGEEVSASDQIWLGEYEEATNGSGDFGASKSSKKVHRTETIEEEKAAVGTGTAAASAAGLALVAKEEGRRLDALSVTAFNVYKQTCIDYREMFVTMKAWMEMREQRHNEMLETVREEFLTRIDAEADLRDKERENAPNETTGIMLAVIAKHLGIDLSQMNGAAPSAKNGAAKKTAKA